MTKIRLSFNTNVFSYLLDDTPDIQQMALKESKDMP